MKSYLFVTSKKKIKKITNQLTDVINNNHQKKIIKFINSNNYDVVVLVAI